MWVCDGESLAASTTNREVSGANQVNENGSFIYTVPQSPGGKGKDDDRRLTVASMRPGQSARDSRYSALLLSCRISY